MRCHPKRRRSIDNPYILEIQGSKYLIKFLDNRNKTQILEINEELYKVFDEFELADIRELHIYERHIEHSEIYDNSLYHRSITESANLETQIINKVILEQIKTIIDNSLSEKQKTRLVLYYFKNMKLKEIAKAEGTTHQAVSKSISKSIEKIHNMIIN